MRKELEILASNVDACTNRIEKLDYSVKKNKELFPLTLETLNELTDDQEESSMR